MTPQAAAEGRHTTKRLNQSGGLLAYQLFCTELYVRQWGQPRPGSRVFIQVIQQINGWQHRPLRLSAVVPTA